MAIGLALLFGIVLPLNFNSPYKATSIIEFWRRWHMTLSRFLRDYLYKPMGGSRRGYNKHYTNIMVTMLLGGLWHGAGWTFVFWGFLHGVYICINHGWRKLRNHGSGASINDGLFVTYVYRGLTFFAVMVAWVFFRAENWDAAWKMFRGLVGLNGLILNYTYLPNLNSLNSFGDWLANAGVVFNVIPHFTGSPEVIELTFLTLLVWMAPNSQEIVRLRRGQGMDIPTHLHGKLLWWNWRPSWQWGFVVAITMVLGIYGIGTYSEFIYFQF